MCGEKDRNKKISDLVNNDDNVDDDVNGSDEMSSAHGCW